MVPNYPRHKTTLAELPPLPRARVRTRRTETLVVHSFGPTTRTCRSRFVPRIPLSAAGLFPCSIPSGSADAHVQMEPPRWLHRRASSRTLTTLCSLALPNRTKTSSCTGLRFVCRFFPRARVSDGTSTLYSPLLLWYRLRSCALARHLFGTGS